VLLGPVSLAVCIRYGIPYPYLRIKLLYIDT
jgi:hypothetical protein